MLLKDSHIKFIIMNGKVDVYTSKLCLSSTVSIRCFKNKFYYIIKFLVQITVCFCNYLFGF